MIDKIKDVYCQKCGVAVVAQDVHIVVTNPIERQNIGTDKWVRRSTECRSEKYGMLCKGCAGEE